MLDSWTIKLKIWLSVKALYLPIRDKKYGKVDNLDWQLNFNVFEDLSIFIYYNIRYIV